MCDAKIRPFPFDMEIMCEVTDSAVHDEHHSVLRDYAYPGSATDIVWFEGDRRTFRGEWLHCDDSRCTLPAGHARDHAF